MLFEHATKMLRHNKQDTGDGQVPIIDLNSCYKDLYDSLNSMNLLKVHFPLGKTAVRAIIFPETVGQRSKISFWKIQKDLP